MGSLVYVGSIAGRGREDLKRNLRVRNADDHLNDMLESVHRNSEMMIRKHTVLRRSYRCLRVAIAV